MERLSYEFVKNEFEKEGFKLLTTMYKNAHQELNYMCPQGHCHHISRNNWKKGARCPYCKGTGKPNIEFIKNEFKKEGYKLLTKKYKNNAQKLNYVCPNGHEHSISWSNWRKNARCPYCAGNSLPTIEFIKKEFMKEGYTFLTTIYKNSHQKLDYICSSRHKHNISWSNWQKGQRCPECRRKEFSIKYSGKNNHMYGKCGPLSPSWKGGISCEPYCDVWLDKEYKESIKERDDYQCLNPDCWGNCNHLPLTIHHIDYNKKNCEPQNLITLCRSCNSRANKDRKWHTVWYQTILNKRYIHMIDSANLVYYTGG